MRTGILISWIFLFFLGCIEAQYSFDFHNSGDFPGQWLGDTMDFVSEKGFLRLKAPSPGASQIFFPYEKLDSARWVIQYRMDFAPSDQNYLEIDLYRSDSAAVPALRYTIRIGENGKNDPIHFTKYSKGKILKEKSSSDSLVAANSSAGILTVQYANNMWKARFFPRGSAVSYPVFQLSDSFRITDGRFGLTCTYTKTRRDKFYFDHIAIGTAPQDTLSPRMLRGQAWSPYVLDIEMSEAIDTTIFDINSLEMVPGIPEKSISYRDKHLLLTSKDSIPAGRSYMILAKGLMDRAGNRTPVDSLRVRWVYTSPVAAFDVIFNEIMADPTPQVNLPDAEYIEIFNRSDKFIDLSELYLSDEGHSVSLPDDTMPPKTFLILTRPGDSVRLASYGKTIGVKGFPGLQNEGERLVLTDYLTNIIDRIRYKTSMHQNKQKRNGGWSLELRHPQLVCSGGIAWHSSIDLNGGTPGKPNSKSSLSPVLSGPELENILVNGASHIALHFNQKLSPHLSLEETDMELSNAMHPREYQVDPYDMKWLNIGFDENIEAGKVYRISIRSGLENCIGKVQDIELSAPFAKSVSPVRGDLLINEILFNPYPDASDFVEFINVSSKVLDLAGLRIANISERDTFIIHPHLNNVLFPGQIIALTKDPEQLRVLYHVPDTAFIVPAALPDWNDDKGNISVFQSHFGSMSLLDQMNYTAEMHSSDYEDVEGVSLERIDLLSPSGNVSNWQSGVSFTHYATPGYSNASSLEKTSPSGHKKEKIFLDKTRFNPGAEGIAGMLGIHYLLQGNSGRFACSVYDMGGQLIKNISGAQPVGSRGFVFWDGLDRDNIPCDTGVYIILAALYEAGTGVYTRKMPVLLER